MLRLCGPDMRSRRFLNMLDVCASVEFPTWSTLCDCAVSEQDWTQMESNSRAFVARLCLHVMSRRQQVENWTGLEDSSDQLVWGVSADVGTSPSDEDSDGMNSDSPVKESSSLLPESTSGSACKIPEASRAVHLFLDCLAAIVVFVFST